MRSENSSVATRGPPIMLSYSVVHCSGATRGAVRRYWAISGLILACLLLLFLLVVDVVLPVPSNLVMIAHGALFGVAIGTFLSLVGSIGAALVGFAIGQRG